MRAYGVSRACLQMEKLTDQVRSRQVDAMEGKLRELEAVLLAAQETATSAEQMLEALKQQVRATSAGEHCPSE